MPDWKATLENAQSSPPSAQAVQEVLSSIDPAWQLADVIRIHGGLGAVLHRIDVRPIDGDRCSLVLRQIMPEWGETGIDLSREATTLARVGATPAQVPVPELLWIDPDGEAFGRPALLMHYVDGHPLIGDLAAPEASAALAATLHQIHTVVIATDHLRCLTNGAEHLEYLGVPPVASAIIDADRLRAAVAATPPPPPADDLVLVHGDFHGGNVLWDGARVTAVLDWPNAAVGDRLWDEAYAFMDTYLAHGASSAELFRSEYRRLGGSPPAEESQRFFDLSALVQALPSPSRWLDSYRHCGLDDLTEAQVEERYISLVEACL